MYLLKKKAEKPKQLVKSSTDAKLLQKPAEKPTIMKSLEDAIKKDSLISISSVTRENLEGWQINETPKPATGSSMMRTKQSQPIVQEFIPRYSIPVQI